MSSNYIEIELDNWQKKALLKYAGFFISDNVTKFDLVEKGNHFIRFRKSILPEIIGELCYHLNHSRSDRTIELLDGLILTLECYE